MDPSRPPPPLERRLEQIRRAIASIDYVHDGSLQRRTKVCGKPACRCALDPAERHGPYYQWKGLRAGRFLQRALSPAEARRLARAIANYRRARRLLARWIRESARHLFAQDEHKP